MKLRRGQIIRVAFDDHVENSNKSHSFTAHGKLVGISKKCLTIDAWYDTRKRPTRRYFDSENYTRWTILRVAITKLEIATQWEEVT